MKFDVIIIGGSYAGLAAAMALGRSMRTVLIIDAGEPCNRTAPQAHNLISHDGTPPGEISQLAKKDVLKYSTVEFKNGFVRTLSGTRNNFTVETAGGESYMGRQIILATGVKDILPTLPGFRECWGISVIRCPYCHGYEFKHAPTAILASGEVAMELAKLIRHWASDLTIVTNGPSNLNEEQERQLTALNIQINTTAIKQLVHEKGNVKSIGFDDGSLLQVDVIYARPEMKQHNDLAEQIGCEMNDHLIKVDEFQKTNVEGVMAVGDNSFMMRSLAASIAAGTKAGAVADRAIIMNAFESDLKKTVAFSGN